MTLWWVSADFHFFPEASALGRTIGFECAGVVAQVGEAVTTLRIGDNDVMAMHGGCIANRIRCHEMAAFPMPGNLSNLRLCHCLLLPHLPGTNAEGQRVLVHSAMGGVGQAAIALAKLNGAHVYGTAGSEAKREALRGMAFDSHSTEWYSDLMVATCGRGVDIFLNSLAGEHVDLCLEALAPGGWHCELAKLTSLPTDR